MSYSVKEIQGTHVILEKESETIIELKGDEKKAREMCRKLNLGAGFNGWTPVFLAKSYGSND
jgi:hypothetical protein